MPRPICFKLLWHELRRAFSRARANTGNKIAAKIAIMAMTTSNSIKVKPYHLLVYDTGIFMMSSSLLQLRLSAGRTFCPI